MKKRILSFMLILSLMFSVAAAINITANAQSKASNFNKVSLTGNGADDVVKVAMAQLERSQSSLGYTEAWCADFVSDCALIAGQSKAIPFNPGVSGMYNAVLSAGGYVTNSPVKGDIAFYKYYSGGFAHVSIVYDNNRNTIHGNVSWCASGKDNSIWHVCTRKPGVYENAMNQSVLYVHPNYSSAVHTHDYKLAGYSSDHPHYAQYKCSCGASYLGKGSIYFSDNCAECKKPIIKEGWYKIACSSNTNYVLDVEYGSKESRKRVQLYDYNGAWDQQKLYVKYVGNGYYTIMFKHSGLALDVTGGSKDPSVVLQQYPFNCSDAQLWNFIPDGNGAYFLRSKLGNFMDLRGNNVQNATLIQSYPPNYSAAQRWKLIPIEKHIAFDTNGGQQYVEAASATADGLNVGRGTNQLIIYNKSGCRTNTNIYGCEAIIGADNKVVSVTGYGKGSSAIPSGGFVLSGHDKMCNWIINNVHQGNYVTYDEKTLEVKVYKDYSAYLMNNCRPLVGQKSIDLPIPTCNGRTFLGWYTEKYGGTKITSDMTVSDTNDITLYAHWSSTVKYGDTNSDGTINMLDVLVLRKHLAKWKNININITAADCNGDNAVNTLDVLQLRKYLAKWNVVLGPQK